MSISECQGTSGGARDVIETPRANKVCLERFSTSRPDSESCGGVIHSEIVGDKETKDNAELRNLVLD